MCGVRNRIPPLPSAQAGKCAGPLFGRRQSKCVPVLGLSDDSDQFGLPKRLGLRWSSSLLCQAKFWLQNATDQVWSAVCPTRKTTPFRRIWPLHGPIARAFSERLHFHQFSFCLRHFHDAGQCFCRCRPSRTTAAAADGGGPAAGRRHLRQQQLNFKPHRDR